MPAHACARRRWRRRRPAGRRRRRARVWVWVRVPYPAWFFLNQVSRVWVASIPLRYPNRTRSSIRIRTDPPTDPLQDWWNAWAWVWVRVPYPAWFFLNRVCGYGLRAYRSAIRIRTDPPTAANSCDCWVRQLGSQQL